MSKHARFTHYPKFGWGCTVPDEYIGEGKKHDGPCAAWPLWWNIPARIRFRKSL